MVKNGEDIPANPLENTPEKQHRPGRRRIRYKIRRKKKSFPERAKKSVKKFFQKQGRWLLILLAAIALVGLLLLGFLAIERNTIYQSSHQTEIE